MTCTAATCSVELLDSTAFTAQQEEWSDLLRRSYDNRLFQTPDWLRVWWEHFGSGSASVYALRDERGQLNAVLPLHVVVRDGQRVLGLVGDYNVMDYMDALAEKDSALELLAQLWAEALEGLEWDRIELRHVPSSSPLLPALQTAAGARGIRVTLEEDEVCPVAILCSSWDGYLQMLTKKQRHEIRRKLRRATEGATYQWRTAVTQEDLDRDLPVFFRLHEASAREKARFMTHEMRDFFHSIASTYLPDGTLRLSIFTRDGVDIAATMSFLYRDRYLLYNSGYDPAFAAYSPGIAAVAHAMQDAIESKAVAFDFLSGDEPYKYQFGATNTYTCKITG